jgi:hypothetical protein
MSMNVGTIDRVLRVVIGLALIAFAIPLGFPQTGWNWIGWIGVAPLITAIVGTCPGYSVLGLSTNRRDDCPSPSTFSALRGSSFWGQRRACLLRRARAKIMP